LSRASSSTPTRSSGLRAASFCTHKRLLQLLIELRRLVELIVAVVVDGYITAQLLEA
jgi:hypothetical protein